MSSRSAASRAAGKAAWLIVQTGSTLPELRARHGDFPDWFRRGLGLRREAVEVVRVDEGARLPPVGRHAGVVVTGSPWMVSERLRWSEAAAAWLRDAVGAGVAILGVCYGHQLLAHALGGRVDYHPGGREVGTIDVELTPEGASDALLGAAPARFRAHATHQQSVLDLPPGAVVLARSAHDPHHAVRYAPRAWGVQFHPEFSVAIMRGYLRRRSPARHGDCPAGCCSPREDAPAPAARRLLRRFGWIASI